MSDRGAGMRAAGPLGRDKRSDSQHRGHADEHVLRLLAENEMLRSTVAAYSAMETKDTRLSTALDTTKQLLGRAEQREERIVQIYDQMLDKFSRAWSKRQREKWLNQWAWTAIIKGSGIAWRKHQSKSGKAFLNFTFHLWRDLHRANIRKGGRILMAIWRRDLQCLSRASRAWSNKSKHRQRVLRFHFVRCYRRSWDAFVEAVVYDRCMRRAGFVLARKTALNCVRIALREWSQASWRERVMFWRRHCRASREALRQAMQPGTYNEFLQRTEGVYGAIPGSITLNETDRENSTSMRGAATALQMHQQRGVSSRSIGIMTSAAFSNAREDALGFDSISSGQVRVVRGSPSRQEIHLSPPAATSSPAFSTARSQNMPEREREDVKNTVRREAGHTSTSARQLEVPTSSLADAQTHKTHPWQKRRFSDSEDDAESTSPISSGAVRTITPPSHARSRPRSNRHALDGAGGDGQGGLRRGGALEASSAIRSLGRTREKEREASRERQDDSTPDNQPPSLLAQPAQSFDQEVGDGRATDYAPAAPTLCLPNSEVKGLLIKWQPQPRAVNYELRYRFRRLDNLYWGSWITMSNSISSTRTLVPARKDAVYCFQARAQTARGWGAWSKASAVLRATPDGGMQYAASSELDGSLADYSIRTHELAGKEGHRSQAENYHALEPLATPSRAENGAAGGKPSRDAVMARARPQAASAFQGGIGPLQSNDATLVVNAEMAPDISAVEHTDSSVLAPHSPGWLEKDGANSWSRPGQSTPPARSQRSPPPPTPEAIASASKGIVPARMSHVGIVTSA